MADLRLSEHDILRLPGAQASKRMAARTIPQMRVPYLHIYIVAGPQCAWHARCTTAQRVLPEVPRKGSHIASNIAQVLLRRGVHA
jgi:hypothetical protein